MKDKKIKIAFQGLFGAYSDQALTEFAQKNNLKIENVESKNFYDLFQKISKNCLAFVPIENSNAGSVVDCVDLLKNNDVEIIAEFYFTVNHTLLVKKNTNFKQVQKVFSHPQALSQCSDFLNKNNLQVVNYLDTSASAKKVAESIEQNIAAIGSEKLAKIYNLKILKKKFQNSQNNKTRFLLVKKRGAVYDFEKKIQKKNKKYKSSVIVELKDQPGALYKILGAFATNNINLTKIESRPLSEKNFSYYFFIDFEGK